MTRYWMGVACEQHARAGRDGGFAQLGHGKQSAVRGLKKGDWIVYYSPREKIDDYLLTTVPAPIQPLLEALELTRGRKANWGIVMRGAKRELSETDFRSIAVAMGVDW